MKCNVIKDLLPNYIDDLCSEETKKLVEEHVECCEECSRVLEVMKDGEFIGGVEKQTQGGFEVDVQKGQAVSAPILEEKSDIAIFRVMKKIVWRRVIVMLASVILAVVAISFVVIMVLGNMHPKWDIEFLNYEKYQMRKTAKVATEALAKGDVESFLSGIQNSVTRREFSDKTDSKVIDISKKHLQEIYEEHLEGEEYTIEQLSTGWSSDYNMDSMYTVDMILNYGKYKLYFSYEFINQDIYLVSCCSEEEDSAATEIATEIDAWCCYAASYFVENDFGDEESLQGLMLADSHDDTEKQKQQCSVLTAITFTEDCVQIKKGYRLLTGEYPEYLKEWGNKVYDFQQNHTLEKIWIQKNGVDDKAQKELRTMIWKFTDSQGREGVMLKEFYYGPGGYEPADDEENVYGDGLSKETLEWLEGMFD